MGTDVSSVGPLIIGEDMARLPKLSGSWTKFYRPVKSELDFDPEVTILNYGPVYLGRQNMDYTGGPADFVRDNPQLFGGGNVSAWEGYFYWALSQKDVRGPEGPEGGWKYQSIVRNQGGRLGQATPDFIISVNQGKDIACRIQTYFHTQLGVEKEASDVEQLFFLQEEYDVVDAFGDLYMDDPTGAAVKQMARRVLVKDPSLTPGSGVYLAELV